MKITDIKTFPYDDAFRDLVFVQVETDEGAYGWGEAGDMGRERATAQELKHYFIDQDPGQIELPWNTVYRDAYRRPDDTLPGCPSVDDLDPFFLQLGDLFPQGLPGRQAEPARPVLSMAGNGLAVAGTSHRIPLTEGEIS